jgi:uncharacterized protein with LGFP repeats
MNAAWDKLGSSGGVLGAPVNDETYDGEVTSQKFSGGQVSWNRQTKQFTTEPPALADQLKGLQVPIDPAAAINMAWRAAGGANGPLGAKQGGQYPIGGDGIVQNFAGGKVFFSPATGANAVETAILAKYESLGGPVGSDLGFPTANESDGGIGSSRICPFSGRRRDLAAIHQRQDLVEPGEEHLHHRSVQPGSVVVRPAGVGTEPAERFGDASARQKVHLALVVAVSRRSGRGADRAVGAGGLWMASASPRPRWRRLRAPP